jgi:hypothetical protein
LVGKVVATDEATDAVPELTLYPPNVRNCLFADKLRRPSEVAEPLCVRALSTELVPATAVVGSVVLTVPVWLVPEVLNSLIK